MLFSELRKGNEMRLLSSRDSEILRQQIYFESHSNKIKREKKNDKHQVLSGHPFYRLIPVGKRRVWSKEAEFYPSHLYRECLFLRLNEKINIA